MIYSYGDFRAASQAVRSDDPAAKPIEITRDELRAREQSRRVFLRIRSATSTPRARRRLKIENALISPVPLRSNGWMVAITLFIFMAFYAVGPGVCVWLALSELMPTRIRSNGMSIALLLNQAVSTTIAAIFLADRRQVWILDHVLRIRRLHGDLFRHGDVVPAGDQRQDAGRD